MEYRLEELCKIGSSKRIYLSEYTESGIPFYRGKEIIEKSNGKKISSQLFISLEKYEEIKSKFNVPKIGDILISAVGTLGKSWFVDEENFYFKDGNLIWLYDFNNEIINNRLKEGILFMEKIISLYNKTFDEKIPENEKRLR